MPESNLEKLKRLLDELFMFDQADLDFGIYRIMNVRRDEIHAFLNDDLLPTARTALEAMGDTGREALEEDLRKAEEQARALGADPATLPKVQELKAKLAASPDAAAAEQDVYSHLFNFFRRYYKDGDFISQRRYKEGVYAIPYEGEEVKLHWAHADQYYIKSSEQFRDYTFLLPDGRRVHFKLTEADTPKDNNRAAAGKDRRFILSDADPVVELDGELEIRFEYRTDEEGRKREVIDFLSTAAVLANPAAASWLAGLSAPVPTENARTRPLLARHVNAYTGKNSFDYFIHKDLGTFLRRELDFYLKNEVMHLDDIDTDGATARHVETYLAKLKAIRAVGHKVIDFLAQLEDFQKRLWLKKKFVVETSWCVTLDRVAPELYAEVATNDAQRADWVRLFAIDAIYGDMVTPAYSEPLTEAFLTANPHLLVDTRFFPKAFTDRLLASIDDLHEVTDGLLIHSENFQALSLLQARYRDQVKCTYIDPPYNTGEDGFVYKDSYQHSSWATLVADRIEMGSRLLTAAAFVSVSTDDTEHALARHLLSDWRGEAGFVADFVWEKRRSRENRKATSVNHDFVLCFGTAASPILNSLPLTDEVRARYRNPDKDPRGPWQSVSLNAQSGHATATQFYSVTTPSGRQVAPPPGRCWSLAPERFQEEVSANNVWFGPDGDGVPRYKHFLKDDAGLTPHTLWSADEVGTNDDAKKWLMGMFPPSAEGFETPKPVGLLMRVIGLTAGRSDSVLDYFAGSGTTAHAVINLNREDDGERKYILVEMGEYFDTVLKPRVLKAAYSKEWKDGKPVGRDGVSQIIKVLRLESYEDTLNNLHIQRSAPQAKLLETDALREDYLLRYWLDVETRDSASLLNIAQFEDPWAYTLEIARGSAAETRPTNVDLVETLNYLLGLRVQHVDVVRGVTMVQGALPSGEKALVLWRKTAEMPSEALDTFLYSQRINPRDMEFDVIYVNGDNHLENTRRPDESWKVRLIEDEFKRLMFETADR